MSANTGSNGGDYYAEVGFDSEDIGGDKVDRYKGRKGYTDRLGFPLSTRLRVADVHFKDKYVLCTKGLCCQKMEPAQKRIGCVVVQYATNKQGDLEQPFRWQVKQWVFSGKKYEDLRGVNSEWPLADHDVKVTCIEDNYQQLKYVACKNAAWTLKPEIRDQIVNEATAALKRLYLGSKLDNDQLRELLGMESEGSVVASDPTSEADLDNIMNQIE